jgi:hypothetical protein
MAVTETRANVTSWRAVIDSYVLWAEELKVAVAAEPDLQTTEILTYLRHMVAAVGSADASLTVMETELAAIEGTYPVISNLIGVSQSSTQVRLTWDTDLAAYSNVDWDTVDGGPYSDSQNNASEVTSHSVTITGLAPSTVYYFVASSGNVGGVDTAPQISVTTDDPSISGAITETSPVNDFYAVAAVGAPRLWCDPDLGASAPVRWVNDARHTAVAVPTALRTVSPADTNALQSALADLQPGDHVQLRPGVTYSGDFNVLVSGTLANFIVIEQEPGSEWWRTDGGNPAIVTGNGFDAHVVSHVVFRHMKFEDISGRAVDYFGKSSTLSGGPDPGQTPGENVLVLGNFVRNTTSSAIAIRGTERQNNPGDYDNTHDVIVESNLIEHGVTGSNENITIANGVDNCDVRYNIVRDAWPKLVDVGREGIDFKNGVSNSRIYGNIVYTLQQRAIYLDGGGGTNHEGVPVLENIEVFNNYTIGGLNDPDNNGGTSITIATEGIGNIDGVLVYNNIFKDTDDQTSGSGYNCVQVYHVSDSESNPGGDQSTIFRGIEIRHNTVVNAWSTGISNTHPDVTDMIIEGNLVYDSGNSHDIYDINGVSSTKNLAKDSDGVTYNDNPPVSLVLPGNETLEDFLYEPQSSTAPGNLDYQPAYLALDFHGRLRTGNWDYGAVQFNAGDT